MINDCNASNGQIDYIKEASVFVCSFCLYENEAQSKYECNE